MYANNVRYVNFGLNGWASLCCCNIKAEIVRPTLSERISRLHFGLIVLWVLNNFLHNWFCLFVLCSWNLSFTRQ